MTGATSASVFFGRHQRLALLASLALNILIIGGVAGTLPLGRNHGSKGGLLGFSHTLPRERSDMIRQKVADAQAHLESTRQGIREARAAARAALVEEPFDQARLSAALDGIVQAEANKNRAKLTLFADTVGQLTAEERHKLHDWLEKRRTARRASGKAR